MTAVDVRKHIARKPKESTTRTVLRRLEDKGYVAHSVVERTFIYRPKESVDSATASALKVVLDRFCGGSIERALLALVGAGLVQPKQIAAIAVKLKQSSR